jgi:hypothetical protein
MVAWAFNPRYMGGINMRITVQANPGKKQDPISK